MPATNARPVSCTLIPARLRIAYPAEQVLVRDIPAMGTGEAPTPEQLAPYFITRSVEVVYAEEAAGRSGEGYLVSFITAACRPDIAGYLERAGAHDLWFFRTTRDARSVVRSGELECDGQRRADLAVLAEDAPGRVLLNSAWGTGYRTRVEALAQAGFVVG